MNNYSVKFKIVIILLFSLQNIWSQNDAKLSIFNYNPMSFNPAYAGSSDGFNIIGIYSSQWNGFDGAPKTQYLSVDNKFPINHIGVGLSINNDVSGPSVDTNFEANFAYYLKLNSEFKLAFGTKIGLNNNSIDFDLLKRLQPEQDVFGSGRIYNKSKILGFGVNIYSKKIYFGISTPNIFKTNYYNSSESIIVANKKNYFYSTIGYKIDLDLEFVFTPSILTRITPGSPISNQFSLNLNWREKWIGGLNFEYKSSIGAFLGVNAIKNFKIGYAYDRSLTSFSQYNNGSHTFFINYYLENANSEKCSCNQY
jgi:type IX secretion system PorP/SprF family membrane protein